MPALAQLKQLKTLNIYNTSVTPAALAGLKRLKTIRRIDVASSKIPAYFDGPVRNAGDRFTELVKNTYRVLLTRGMRGCYVCFLDKETEQFFWSRTEAVSAAYPEVPDESKRLAVEG